jgi:hypothetical protein
VQPIILGVHEGMVEKLDMAHVQLMNIVERMKSWEYHDKGRDIFSSW